MHQVPRGTAGRRTAVLSALAAAGALFRIIPAWLPLQWQLGHILSDDTFYYLTIARRLARSGLPSFDGLAPTNGFHPLWLALITPFFTVSISDIAALRLVITLCGLLDTMSLLLLIRILRGLHIGFFATGVTAALYAVSPALLSHAGPLNGLETSLTLFLLFALLGSYTAVVRSRRDWHASPGFLGAVMGLAVLARTDTIIIVAVLVAAIALRNEPGSRRFALRTAGVAIVVLSPWVLWNMLTFGTVIQVSGEAHAFSMRALYQTSGWGPSEYFFRFLLNCADVFRFFPVTLETDTKLSLAFLTQSALVAAVALYVWISVRRRLSQSARVLRKRFLLLAPPLMGGVLFVLAHSVTSIALRGWYYASLLPASTLLLAAAVDYLSRSPRGPTRNVWCIAGSLVILVLISTSVADHLHRRQGEVEKFTALSAMEDVIPRGGRVGSWNAGVYGYFFSGRTVVNLDGLVNNGVFPHLSDRTLGEYCRTARIAYLVDAKGAFRIWEQYWSDQPGALWRSVRVVKSLGPENAESSVTIASVRANAVPRE